MITGSVLSFLSLGGTFMILFITTIVFTTLTTPLVSLSGGGGEAYPDCHSSDTLSSPWITRLLFSLLQLSSSARFLIALLSWLWPLLFIFLLPVVFVAFLYVTALLLQMYVIRHWLLSSFKLSRNHSSSMVPRELLQRLLAAVWNAHGRIFHGYEICGVEKLPKEGPVFLIYYHGTLPLDAYYFIARFQIEWNRVPIPVVDRFLFRIPGIQRILNLIGAVEGSVDECAGLLTRSHAPINKAYETSNSDTQTGNRPDIPGEIVILSPGGVREALFADEYYSVVWGKRRGFARVAIKSKQPIYPVFTENVREAIRVVQYGKSWWRWLYELTRLPFAIFYGYFPVKLRTYIGDPIYPKDSETDEELADRVKLAMEEMIARYQWLPGSVMIALLQRFRWFDDWIRSKNEQHYSVLK